MIFDLLILPETGSFEIHQVVHLAISAEQARKQVDRFLLNEVSHLMAADPPDLVVGKRTVWRVPIWIGFPRQGRFAVGAIDVDAETGNLIDANQQTAALMARFGACSNIYPRTNHASSRYVPMTSPIGQAKIRPMPWS